MSMMQPMGVPGAPMFTPAAHGQMMFTASQRPQPKMGQQTHTYNILPMISFKVHRSTIYCLATTSVLHEVAGYGLAAVLKFSTQEAHLFVST